MLLDAYTRRITVGVQHRNCWIGVPDGLLSGIELVAESLLLLEPAAAGRLAAALLASCSDRAVALPV